MMQPDIEGKQQVIKYAPIQHTDHSKETDVMLPNAPSHSPALPENAPRSPMLASLPVSTVAEGALNDGPPDPQLERLVRLSKPFIAVAQRDNEFKAHLDQMDRNLRARRLGGGTRQSCLVLIGASGAGKSKLLAHHLVGHPSYGEMECGRYIPGSNTLWFEAPAVVNTKSFNIAALATLGIPASSRASEFELSSVFKDALIENRIDRVIVDEMQHVIRGAQRATIKKVQDVVKSMLQIDNWPVQFIISGTHDMKNFLEGDRQLANRCRVMRLQPVLHKTGFNFVERLIQEILIDTAGLSVGWTSEDQLHSRLIQASAGAMGTMIQTIRQACFRAIDEGRNTVVMDDFIHVYQADSGCLSKDNIFKSPNWMRIKPENAVSDLNTESAE